MKNMKKDNRGMTMVEVLMGFVILSLMIGMLSNVIAFATNMYQDSVSIKRVEENLEQYIYKKDVPLTGSGSVLTVKEVHVSGSGSETITDARYEEGGTYKNVTLNERAYTLSSKEFPAIISEEEDMEIVITFLK